MKGLDKLPELIETFRDAVEQELAKYPAETPVLDTLDSEENHRNALNELAKSGVEMALLLVHSMCRDRHLADLEAHEIGVGRRLAEVIEADGFLWDLWVLDLRQAKTFANRLTDLPYKDAGAVEFIGLTEEAVVTAFPDAERSGDAFFLKMANGDAISMILDKKNSTLNVDFQPWSPARIRHFAEKFVLPMPKNQRWGGPGAGT